VTLRTLCASSRDLALSGPLFWRSGNRGGWRAFSCRSTLRKPHTPRADHSGHPPPRTGAQFFGHVHYETVLGDGLANIDLSTNLLTGSEIIVSYLLAAERLLAVFRFATGV
jgi:hypothetical protein